MTKNKIHIICSWYNIDNYTINGDLSIDVDGDVNLYHNELEKLPLKFRNVTGYFDCSFNNLTSLEGAPSSVGGQFDCKYNPLESLEGIPINLSEEKLIIPDHFTYSDYLKYFRNLKFNKILNLIYTEPKI